MRVLHPADGIYAFYEGRGEGHPWDGADWVDEGALFLGIASYAIVDGDEALVYDTTCRSSARASSAPSSRREGVTRFTVVLSHRHLDHIAGTEAFADCEVLATERTAEPRRRARPPSRRGRWTGRRRSTRSSCPPGPSAADTLDVGRTARADPRRHPQRRRRRLWLPGERLLSPGARSRTPSPTSTSPTASTATSPTSTGSRELEPERILPNHGDPDVIGAGGYPKGLIAATCDYVGKLQRCRTEPELRETKLIDFVGHSMNTGSIHLLPRHMRRCTARTSRS